MPSEVAFGQVSSPNDLNQLVDILQRKTGQVELVPYYIDSWSNAAGDESGCWVSSQSRGTTPVSVTIDTSISGAVSCNAPSTNLLNTYGFHAYTTSAGAAVKFYVGGIGTIQY